MKKLMLVSILLLSCGQGETPHGKTRDYLSSEHQLYVTAGEGGGYCVYGRHRSGKVTLVTARGALNAEQLGQALSYMSYWSQTASSALPTASLAYIVVRFVKKSAKTRALVGGVLLFGAAHMINGVYRIIKGAYEGESGGAIAAQFAFGWMPFNFLVEDMQRRGRLETFANQYERAGISERKLRRITAKLRRKKPAFPDACVPVE